jgi:hypothetical protein
MTQRKIQYWVIPPKSDSEFVASMEMILETYAQPYDSRCPVICMDEQPIQFQAEVRVPIPATAQHPKRVDYEYERRGTASIFMFTEPLTGWRQATARSHRRKSDWAHEVRRLMTHEYAEAERVILVCDNLNTHTPGAFYETFPPEVARELVRRLEIRYTPKHGSWLNIAENELSALTRQCMGVRRIESLEVLSHEIERWASHRNAKQKGVDWQFKIENARVKLKSLYPKYLT